MNNTNNILKKENLKPLLVLTLICVVVAALLAAVNMITAPEIEARRLKEVQESLHRVMPDGEFNESPDELRSDAPDTVKEVYTEKNGKGYVVVLVTNKGYTGKNIGITVAIDGSGKILNAVITQNEESIVPDMLKPGKNYGDAYIGATADTVAEVVTGATVKYTEAAIKGAINDAFVYLKFKENSLPRTDEELLTLAYGMVENAISFTDVTPEGTKLVKRVYRENSGKGYVVYAHTYAYYGGTLETENLVHVDNSGKIIKVEDLLWKVSDHPDYTPPAQSAVDEFYSRFNDKTVDNIGEVELVSGATNTSTNVRNAMTEVLSVVNELLKTDVTETEVQLMALARELVGDDAEFTNLTPGNIEFVKRVYRENSGKGYVVLAETVYDGYGIDNSMLIHIGSDGKIENIKKLHFYATDTLPEKFTPPAQEVVDAFYERIDGKDTATLGGVELITGATNSSRKIIGSVEEALDIVSVFLARDSSLAQNSQNGGNN